MTTFGSVCSGIEAASVAWGPIGWHADWFAEIEPFPSAVLAHHYPSVPNLGDMRAIARRVLTQEVQAPDILCGGTPCQAFSVAGLRQSLADDRGNLTLTFVGLADAIDHVRGQRGDQPAIVFWENVPGVLSTKDNAFGCFLGALVGESTALVPAGGRWTNAGAVYGPKRAAAWRVLDAQYFGVAQRRRRVFVVASARNGFDPAAVLFEFDGVRRDTAPRREAGEGAARGVIKGAAIGRKPEAGPQYGETLTDGSVYTLNCVDQHAVIAETTHNLRGEGFDASEDGTGRGTPLVPVETGVRYAYYSHDYAHDRLTDPAGVNPAITAEAHARGNLNVAVPVGVTIHGTDPTVKKVASYDDLAQCLRARTPGNIDNSSTTVVQQPVAFSSKDYGADASQDLAPTLRAMNHADSHANGGGQMAVATLDARTSGGGFPGSDGAMGGHVQPHGMQVRRLTPTECERLQGFPDDYTAIPWRGKPASECPDGPRYKALGNSWAVPNVRWIGQRIKREMERTC